MRLTYAGVVTSAREHRREPDWETTSGPLLIAGDFADLPVIEQIGRRLPPDAHGAIKIEVATHLQARPLDVPEGVAVAWLPREEGVRARTVGERLATAVHAWCVEWTCGSDSAEWTVWLGSRTSPHVARMARSLLGVRTPPGAD